MASEPNAKELTFDILFGLGGELSGIGLKPVQGALLDAFKQAANAGDLATRLAVPIHLLTVTGAKVVTTHGYRLR
jgi:hypothetical protein